MSNTFASSVSSKTTAGKVEDGRTRRLKSLLSTAKRLSLFVVLRRWYWTSALRVLLAELRNLAHRISWALEIRAWELRGYKEPSPTTLARTSIGSPQKYAYIHYIQRLQARHPSLTIVDFYLAARSWKDGSEWESRTDILRSQTETQCSSDPPNAL